MAHLLREALLLTWKWYKRAGENNKIDPLLWSSEKEKHDVRVWVRSTQCMLKFVNHWTWSLLIGFIGCFRHIVRLRLRNILQSLAVIIMFKSFLSACSSRMKDSGDIILWVHAVSFILLSGPSPTVKTRLLPFYRTQWRGFYLASLQDITIWENIFT